MKFLTIIFVFTLATNVFAKDCQEYLFGNFKDSFTHQINIDDIIIDSSLKNMSYLGLRRMLKKYKCPLIAAKRIKCGEAVKGNALTEICFTKNRYGYFIIQRDFLDNLNIIVNRWD